MLAHAQGAEIREVQLALLHALGAQVVDRAGEEGEQEGVEGRGDVAGDDDAALEVCARGGGDLRVRCPCCCGGGGWFGGGARSGGGGRGFRFRGGLVEGFHGGVEVEEEGLHERGGDGRGGEDVVEGRAGGHVAAVPGGGEGVQAAEAAEEVFEQRAGGGGEEEGEGGGRGGGEEGVEGGEGDGGRGGGRGWAEGAVEGEECVD